jgi:hypothetical protein
VKLLLMVAMRQPFHCRIIYGGINKRIILRLVKFKEGQL